MVHHPWEAPVLEAPLYGCRWSPRPVIISLNDETARSFPFFGLRLSRRDSSLIPTSVSFSSPRPRPLPPLLPFISELCNFLLATVPPCRAEIGVRSNDFVEMRIVAEEGETGATVTVALPLQAATSQPRKNGRREKTKDRA